ncbi:hypothetical protein [Novacetimonas pomaceti]|uniref:hypothetical protein n=1 Tax=Novacetimonas pomaceti TaxID=2021998 RepID=UPI001C2D73C3|nr:hypothetical protein [Novacetimonas pomaceti]MBV1833050.1 hypothetical protein [Novacetimonas pomaceti]
MIWAPYLWILTDVAWFSLIGAVGFNFVKALRIVSNSKVTFAQATDRSKGFWVGISKILAALCVVSLAIAFLYPKSKPVPAVVHEITTGMPSPNFSCLHVQKEGNNWHIMGAITINRSVLSDSIIGPHSIKIGNIDVYTYLELECGSLSNNK